MRYVRTMVSRGWYSLSSPIWANFDLDRGPTISCFGSYRNAEALGETGAEDLRERE